jgi:hypothetical protein
MTYRTAGRTLSGLMAAAMLYASATAWSAELITAAEAALPNSPDAGMTLRGISRGPAIEQVSPAPGAKRVTSPVSFIVKLNARNNEKIDKDTVKVIYLKAQPVDLTPRIKAFLGDGGIEMKDAELPLGTHVLRIDVKDGQGRSSTALLTLKVEAK